jgi:tRNA-dihydrouridine synthase
LVHVESLPLDAVTLSPPVALAPLAGITDLPFRQLVASFGVGWVVSEMVASQEMVQAKPGVRERAELGFNQAGTAVQIAGRDAYWMAEAARMVEANGAAMIDINIRQPARRNLCAPGLIPAGVSVGPLPPRSYSCRMQMS